jgi:hypothetical protein
MAYTRRWPFWPGPHVALGWEQAALAEPVGVLRLYVVMVPSGTFATCMPSQYTGR